MSNSLVLLLLLVVVMSCLVASTVGFAEVFRRAAMMSLTQASKRQDGGKQCCLPSELTLSSVIELKTSYDPSYEYSRPPRDEGSFDLVYSAKANKIFFRPKSRYNESMFSVVAGIDSGKITAKFSREDSCQYSPLAQFSDSFLTSFVDGQLCIPEVFLNYRGSDSLDGQQVEVYNLYNFDFENEISSPKVNRGSLQMKAIRFEDGSCLPVEVVISQTTQQPDFSYNYTYALKSPSYSMSADFNLFDSAC